MKKTILILSLISAFILNINAQSNDTSNVSNNSDSTVFVFLEENPEYPGGDEARIKFIVKNINYPQEAKETGIQGTVYITFIVETDGSISNVRVLRGIGGGCDEEAVRVIKMMPKWNPGMQKGRAVRCQFNMPIKFVLGSGKKDKTSVDNDKKWWQIFKKKD